MSPSNVIASQTIQGIGNGDLKIQTIQTERSNQAIYSNSKKNELLSPNFATDKTYGDSPDKKNSVKKKSISKNII